MKATIPVVHLCDAHSIRHNTHVGARVAMFPLWPPAGVRTTTWKSSFTQCQVYGVGEGEGEGEDPGQGQGQHQGQGWGRGERAGRGRALDKPKTSMVPPISQRSR